MVHGTEHGLASAGPRGVALFIRQTRPLGVTVAKTEFYALQWWSKEIGLRAHTDNQLVARQSNKHIHHDPVQADSPVPAVILAIEVNIGHPNFYVR